MFTRDYGLWILKKIFLVYLQKSGTALAGQTGPVPTPLQLAIQHDTIKGLVCTMPEIIVMLILSISRTCEDLLQ